MRYSASDKTEIIRVVEQSHLPARRTLEKLGIPRSSFYRWYDRHQRGGPEALADRPSRPDRVWNRIPEAIRSQIVDLALVQPELSPRELAVRFTDEEKYFVSEASVYRLLKAHDLITTPAYNLTTILISQCDKAPRDGFRSPWPCRALRPHSQTGPLRPRARGRYRGPPALLAAALRP